MKDYLHLAKAFVLHRYYTARDSEDGITTTEVALLTGALLGAAALLVVAIRAKLAEKIGIINNS